MNYKFWLYTDKLNVQGGTVFRHQLLAQAVFYTTYPKLHTCKHVTDCRFSLVRSHTSVRSLRLCCSAPHCLPVAPRSRSECWCCSLVVLRAGRLRRFVVRAAKETVRASGVGETDAHLLRQRSNRSCCSDLGRCIHSRCNHRRLPDLQLWDSINGGHAPLRRIFIHVPYAPILLGRDIFRMVLYGIHR